MHQISSTPPLTDSEQAAWQEQGYFIRERVFSPEECQTLGDRAAELALGRRPMPAAHRDRNALVESGECNADGLAAMHKIHHPHLYDELFHVRQRDTRVTEVVAGLLGQDLLGINSLFIFKPPRHGMGFPWHQDYWYFRRRFTTDTTVGTWQAIDPASQANGCLWVIPGSHLSYIRDHRALSGPQQSEYREADGVDESRAVPVEIPAGSVLFFHSWLLHRSLPNQTTDSWRRCYVAHYLSAHATPTEHIDDGQPINQVRGRSLPGCVQAQET